MVEPVLIGLASVEDHGDRGVVVLQIAVGGQGPQVDPLAQVGVAQEAVVVLVRVALEDRLLDLAADAADRADRVPLAALGPQEDRLPADVARAFDPREGVDLGLLVDVNRTVRPRR